MRITDSHQGNLTGALAKARLPPLRRSPVPRATLQGELRVACDVYGEPNRKEVHGLEIVSQAARYAYRELGAPRAQRAPLHARVTPAHVLNRTASSEPPVALPAL